MVVNEELYNRWRDLVIKYGGKVPRFDQDGSGHFFCDVCVAAPYDVKIVPIKKNSKRKRISESNSKS